MCVCGVCERAIRFGKMPSGRCNGRSKKERRENQQSEREGAGVGEGRKYRTCQARYVTTTKKYSEQAEGKQTERVRQRENSPLKEKTGINKMLWQGKKTGRKDYKRLIRRKKERLQKRTVNSNINSVPLDRIQFSDRPPCSQCQIC